MAKKDKTPLFLIDEDFRGRGGISVSKAELIPDF